MQIKRINRQKWTKSISGDVQMARVLRYGKGRGSITMDSTQRDLIMDTIKAAEPSIVKVLESETERLAKDSEEKWLVREKKSKGSKFKHQTGIRIIPPYTIEAFVENTAPYAWAIKVGRESSTNIREGRRLADVVLWTPARKNAQKVVERIASETVKRIK
tara:strand:+ start:1428 stop:1907 length:480 start_codon:yes stop_codon:yes gene_type:complete